MFQDCLLGSATSAYQLDLCSFRQIGHTGRDDQLRVHYDEYTLLNGRRERLVSRVGDGSIVVRFDRTPVPKDLSDVVCPHFLELKWATGCPYKCAWCYLQGTFRFLEYRTKPRPKDFNEVRRHLAAFFEGDGVRPEILNSGELSDSLLTEKTKRPFSRFIMDVMATQKRHKVLFVTKSADIENLLKISNPEQAIVSFSVNAESVARRWEKAPKVSDRLKAAERLKEAGFEVRIRIDPIVPVTGWTKHYSRLVDTVFERFTPDRITLGSLRGLQSTINNARDKSWIVYLGETSNWGKKIETQMRLDMYSTLIHQLRDDYGFDRVALCKETKAMWGALGLNYRRISCNCTP